MKKIFIIALIVFSASMSKAYSQNIIFEDKPIYSSSVIPTYPIIVDLTDTMIYHFPILLDTCEKKIEFLKIHDDILLNAKQSEVNYWKQAFNSESKYSKVYREELFGFCILTVILTTIIINKN
jgi:hypothetical protein